MVVTVDSGVEDKVKWTTTSCTSGDIDLGFDHCVSVVRPTLLANSRNDGRTLGYGGFSGAKIP